MSNPSISSRSSSRSRSASRSRFRKSLGQGSRLEFATVGEIAEGVRFVLAKSLAS